MAADLLAPILEGGIENVNFFNGRVLTGQAMQAEQQANREHRRYLGRAIGEGIVEGLEVSLDQTSGLQKTVLVQAGTALNRRGEMLKLGSPAEVSIVVEEEEAARANGQFVACSEVKTEVARGTGVYVLVLAPASGLEGSAPRVGLYDRGVARTCDRDVLVEGVRFRLLHIDVESINLVPSDLVIGQKINALMKQPSMEAADRSRLRNLLAHLCLGTEETAAFARNLYDTLGTQPASPQYGPLDRMRELKPSNASRLQESDVPLALIYWTENQIEMLDMWAVRRRLHRRPESVESLFSVFDRRAAEAEAVFLQFQDHMRDVVAGRTQSTLRQIRLMDYFRFVPPVGLIPERVGSANGFTHLELFQNLTTRSPVFIEGAKVRQLLHQSHAYPPIVLPEKKSDEKELIWLYRVRQNRQPSPGSTAAQAYLLFASGHIPFQGDAHYDVARWDFSNYGRIVNE